MHALRPNILEIIISFSMLPQSPAALALQAIKNFRQKEIRAPTIRVLKPYRAPIPKSISSPRSNDTQVKPHGQPNPFLPRFNTKTGRWAPPKYSLRQQAELIKKAKASNTLHLLPPGPKFAVSNVREKDAVVWEGEPKPKVLGAETGNRLYAGKKRMFKGHKRERTRGKREIRRSILLRNMKKRIIRYKGVSFCIAVCSSVRSDRLLASITTGDGHTRSNQRRHPSQRSYRSSEHMCTKTGCKRAELSQFLGFCILSHLMTDSSLHFCKHKRFSCLVGSANGHEIYLEGVAMSVH